VADGVDASVEADEPARLDAMRDGARHEPRTEELSACDDSVLAGGDLGDRCVI
jgi:hypothetical protein